MAAVARAQTQPIPELPEPTPEPPRDEGGEVAVAIPTTSRPSPWEYSLGAGIGWESNVGLGTGESPSDFGGILRGGLTYAARKRAGELRLAGDAVGYAYVDQTRFNRVDGNLSFDGSRRFTERTSGTLGLGVSYAHSDTSQILIDQGVILPLTRTAGYSASAAASHQMSQRTGLRGTVRAYRFDFPDSVDVQGGASLRTSLALSRRLDERNALSFEGAAERAWQLADSTAPSSPVYWTYYGSSQWNRQVSPRTALMFEGGASYTPEGETAGLGRTWSFYGGVSANQRFKRSTLTAYYRREVVPLFGVGGLRAADRLGFDLSAPLGRRWGGSLGGSFTRDAFGSSSAERQHTADTNMRLGFRVARRLSLSAEARYLYRSSPSPTPSTNDFRVGIFLSLVRPTG